MDSMRELTDTELESVAGGQASAGAAAAIATGPNSAESAAATGIATINAGVAGFVPFAAASLTDVGASGAVAAAS